MVKTITLAANIPADREISITLPSDIPLGPADIVVVVASRAATKGHTLGDLLKSEFVGMWQDRDDIEDSAAFARHLRETAWRQDNPPNEFGV
jgi:hypothetical protein